MIGQSRGGALARSLAVRNPDSVAGLVMLGSPVVDSLAVSSQVLRTVRWVAALGDIGVPGVFSSTCKDGACCAQFRAELAAPLPRGVRATAVYSRSDGIVDWQRVRGPAARRPSRLHRATAACRSAWTSTARSTRRSTRGGNAHGMDESDRLVVPAHRERDDADAHRRREHLRGTAAAVRAAARDGRGQARPGSALPPEGALRAAGGGPADLGRRSALQPRLPPAPHRDSRAGRRAGAAPDGRARVLAARWTATSRCGSCGWSRA